MSNSFYSHLVSILVQYLNANLKKGDRFRIVLEEAVDRKQFYDAIKANEYCREIAINGITNNPNEEQYDTVFLEIGNGPRLIIGNIDSANLDYLATLRNSVTSGRKFQDDALLVIIAETSSATIDTTTKMLDADGMPFSPVELAKSIQSKIDAEIVNKKIKCYLTVYIDSIKEETSCHQYSIKDFKALLELVYNGTFVDSSYELKFFKDELIPTNDNNLSDDEFEERVKLNANLYRKIEQIMHNPDAEERIKLLSDIFEESFAARLARLEEEWYKKYTIGTLIQNFKKKGKKNIFDNFEVLNGNVNDYNIFPRDKKKNKNQHVVVFDPRPDADSTDVRISFLYELPSESYPDNCVHSKKTVKINLSKEGFNYTFDKRNSKYCFRIVRLPISKSAFETVAPYFNLANDNTININLPSNPISDVFLGTGSNLIDASKASGVISWNEDLKIMIPASDDDSYTFSVDFGNEQTVSFEVKGGSRGIVPKEPLAIIQDVLETKSSYLDVENPSSSIPFRTLRSQECMVTNISEIFSRFLSFEKFLIDNKYTTVSIRRDENGVESITGEAVELPEKVQDAYNELCNCFSIKKSVPSLTYIDEELRLIIDKYVSAVNSVLSTIEESQILSKVYKNLTRLGVVEDLERDRVYLSPLHPILACYNSYFSNEYNGISDCPSNILKVATPFYLMPFIAYSDREFRPYKDKACEGIRTWLFYEIQNNQEQVRIDNITTKVVKEKISQFLSNFSFLFRDPDTPLRINAIGIDDGENVVVGIVNYIKACLEGGKSVQRIELCEYINDLARETFMEKLYRIAAVDMIIDEFKDLKVNLEKGGVYSSLDVVRLLLTKVSYYKLGIERDENTTRIKYCHLAFYRIRKTSSLGEAANSRLRSEMSYDGLISQPSTIKTSENRYTIGFGTKGLDLTTEDGGATIIYRTASLYNELYINAYNSDNKVYHKGICLAKNYEFTSTGFLDNIYENSNWVTFISPEVDLNFFYRENLYIVYFTDQLTLGSRYDSITVTRQTGQYNTLLDNSLKTHSASILVDDDKIRFRQNMLYHFNSLNGRWLLSLVTKSKYQVQEKISLVATSMILRRIMSRHNNLVWIPVSLDEVVRVTGSIGLSSNNIFSKTELGIKGAMSDDLLLMGLDTSGDELKMVFYPVEVKVSNNSLIAAHGESQVEKTFGVFDDNLCGQDNFIKNVYRSFFCNLFLSTADKMSVYGLISEIEYQAINDNRIKLQNLDFKCSSKMVGSPLGQCALVVYNDGDFSLNTSKPGGPAICNVVIPFVEGVKYVAGNSNNVSEFIEQEEVVIDHETREYMNKEPLEHVVEPDEDDNESLDTDEDNRNETPQSTNSAQVESTLENETVSEVETTSEQTDLVNSQTNNSSSGIVTPGGTTDSVDISSVREESSEQEEPEQVTNKEPLEGGTEQESQLVPAPEALDTHTVVTTVANASVNHNMRILLGNDKASQVPFYFEPNNPRRLEHPNMGIVGTMGTGKTQLLKSIIAQLAKEGNHNVGGHPVGQLIFDYKGDYNSDDYLDKIGGECYFSNLPFNPLKLFVTKRNMAMNLPAVTAERIADSLARAYNSGPVQQAQIKNAILDAYEEFGITRDPSTWNKVPPTIPDVITRYLREHTATDTVYALFSSLDNCSIFDPDPTQCVSIFEWLDGPKVIDLSVFDAEEIKRVIVSLILDVFNSEMLLMGGSQTDEDGKRELRAMIIVDEASQFLAKDFISLRKILSQGRMFGVGMILSTQNVNDFKTREEDYSQFVLSWAIHKVNGLTKNDLGKILGNTNPNLNAYLSLISTAEMFNSIVKIGNDIHQMIDKPFYRLLLEDIRFEN